MSRSSRLDALIDSLRCMPGVGRKSAQRIADHLLQRNREGALAMARALQEAVEQIGHCQRCRNFSETPICDVCSSERRDKSLLCVVESPADVQAVNEAGFNGVYFVLMGHLSPLDGIGPEELGLDLLGRLLDEEAVQEVILATNYTVEGEATAHFIGEMVRSRNKRVSRLAHGLPVGGELEYIDSGTLSEAISGRRDIL